MEKHSFTSPGLLKGMWVDGIKKDARDGFMCVANEGLGRSKNKSWRSNGGVESLIIFIRGHSGP